MTNTTAPAAHQITPTGAGAHLHRHASATILNVCASRTHAPRFDEMVTALGAPLPDTTLPSPLEIDPGEVAEVCAQHGITILGPPPPPLSDGR